MRTLYLCGPIKDRTDSECKDWREYVTKKWSGSVLNPMVRDYRDDSYASVKDVVEPDKRDIDNSDGLIVYFDRPSVGSSMEVLYAWEHKKPVVVVYEGTWPPSPWLVYHSSHIVKTFDEALAILETLV